MNKRKGSQKNSKRRQLGIRWKMLSIFFVFILFFTLVIWIFQIQMLIYFYHGVKYKELDATLKEIQMVKDDNLQIVEIASRKAKDNYEDIWVYRVEDGVLNEDRPIVFSDGSHDSRAVFLQRRFDDFYSEAKNNENHFISVFTVEYSNEKSHYEFKFLDDNKGKPNEVPRIHRNLENVNAIQLDVITIEDGSELLIIQRSNLTPMSALVDTVKTQVVFTSTILVIFSIVMVVLTSKFITKPIIQINESAKRLANGKYDVDFTGDSYREISELSDTLNYAAVELSKNDKLQKELISNISHDLRTPLTMIRGYSELMRDIPGEVNPENFQVIIDETTRLAELVSAMLDLSKIQSGVRVPDKQLFCITEIVKSTLIRYEKLITQEGYKIDFVFDDEVFVCADRTMILQVIYNFINNAINYTGANKYVCVEQKVFGDKIRISVIDTGEGISDEHISYIWDRYYKVDKVHRRATVGSGLGLSIAKGILESHGASYGVESEIGKGSTFYFELDKVDPQEYQARILKF